MRVATPRAMPLTVRPTRQKRRVFGLVHPVIGGPKHARIERGRASGAMPSLANLKGKFSVVF
ncbi:hypothetical protein FHX76_000492 [Lysinibacter cavernae]|uniref:Uncharacterized protein n=1 Tax=Lysinibacter cavernae TaxID=1640652 RepID=A0A7X5QZ56_9MICO|nr:hypothetical protein [Lysinibacter cavernae]